MLNIRAALLCILLASVPAFASPSPSQSGATVPIFDSAGNSWTVVSGVVQENGVNAGATSSVTLLLWYNGGIYQQNQWGNWWGPYTTAGWGNQLAGDPRTPPPTGTQATSADAFRDTLGTHVHFESDWIPGPGPEYYAYANDAEIIASLQYAGIRHVRGWFNDVPGSTKRQARTIADLTAAGAKIDFQVTGPEYSAGFNYRAWVQAHTSIVEAVEGGNEIDNGAAAMTGCSGDTYQVSICAMGILHTDFGTTGIAVYSPSLMNQGLVYKLGDLSADLGKVNSHIYPGWNSNPAIQTYNFIQAALVSQQVMGPGKPTVITEGGWWDAPGITGNLHGTSQPTGADLKLGYLLDANVLGVSRTYFYELLNELYTTPSNQENDFGLFDWWGNPKAEGQTFHNLFGVGGLLTDTGPGTPGKLAYTLTGMPPLGHSTLFQKTDGSFWLAIWRDDVIFNGNTGADVAITDAQVTLTPATKPTSMASYQPSTGTGTGIVNTTNGPSFMFPLNRHPVFIKVVP
jgi:hypothetical protein